ncbi:unnamed protein product [Rotaria sp. Silwood2]|nr:unnamed protein product [Rotaria sp. Silwood2]
MNQHKTISTLIELGRQKKKRRLNLQRDNYEYHTDLDINIIESFTSAAYRFSTTEENDEFKWNDSISTSHNNTNGEAHFELPCKGNACVNCKKCCDWYYTGNLADWQWIRNIKNWRESDRQHWKNGDYYQYFQLRDGATCDHGGRYGIARNLYNVGLGSFGSIGIDVNNYIGHID